MMMNGLTRAALPVLPSAYSCESAMEQEKKKRILIVDDEEAILKILRIKLRVSGYEVLMAHDGRQALELIETARPDAVILDIIMPEMDGFQLLERLKSLPPVPVIAASAWPENGEKALALGAKEFISKPFNVDYLVDRIQTVLDNHKS